MWKSATFSMMTLVSKTRKFFVRLAITLGVLLSSSTLFAASAQKTVLEGEIFGSSYHISIAGRLKEADKKALQTQIDKRLQAFNKTVTAWDKTSILMRFNAEPVGLVDKPLYRNKDFVRNLETSLEVARLTDGAFDPTIGKLVNYWGFGADGNPSKKDNEAARHAHVKLLVKDVGYQYLHPLPFGAIQKDKPFYLDFGGVAKGDAVELISVLLLKAGYPNHLVDIGGKTA